MGPPGPVTGFPLPFISIIRLRRIGGTRNVARMREMRNACTVFVRTHERNKLRMCEDGIQTGVSKYGVAM
jgi:hypothetical protein